MKFLLTPPENKAGKNTHTSGQYVHSFILVVKVSGHVIKQQMPTSSRWNLLSLSRFFFKGENENTKKIKSNWGGTPGHGPLDPPSIIPPKKEQSSLFLYVKSTDLLHSPPLQKKKKNENFN